MLRFASIVCLGAVLLGACASPAPPAGTAASEVRRTWGQPTATYALDGGGQRHEYATGPWGRMTWMIDLDAQGRVTQARQVLTEAEFFQVQSQTALTQGALLRWIGTPGERRGARGGGQTWSWRYPTNDCLWFQASLDAAGLVQSSSFGIDPTCDAPNDKRE